MHYSAPDTTFYCNNFVDCLSGPLERLVNTGDNRYNCFDCNYDQCAECVSAQGHLAGPCREWNITVPPPSARSSQLFLKCSSPSKSVEA